MTLKRERERERERERAPLAHTSPTPRLPLSVRFEPYMLGGPNSAFYFLNTKLIKEKKIISLK